MLALSSIKSVRDCRSNPLLSDYGGLCRIELTNRSHCIRDSENSSELRIRRVSLQELWALAGERIAFLHRKQDATQRSAREASNPNLSS